MCHAVGDTVERREWENCYAGHASLVVVVALVAIGALLAAGYMTPGIGYHIAAYLAAGCLLIAAVPFTVAAVLLCRSSHTPPPIS